MPTQTFPQLRTSRRTASSGASHPQPSRAKRLGAGFLSLVLCVGLMPAIPAWGDEPAAQAAPSGAASEATTPQDNEGSAASPEASAHDAAAAGNADAAQAAAGADAPSDAAGSPATADTATAETAASPQAAGTDSLEAGATPAADGAAANPAADSGTNQEAPAADNPDGTTVVGKAVDQYFPTDEKATAKLLKKLTARFSADGDDGKLSADTVDAAIALNALGKGADIDADALIKRLAKEEKAAGSLTLSQYGRYIMALTAAGIDCAKAEIGGKTRNLVVEMEKLTAETEPTVEDAVYMLPVYGNDGYRNISGTTPEELIEIILDAQDDEGFFWTDAKAETYSIPLTSRALLALIPYSDDDLVDKEISAKVAEATAAASEALYDAQLIDGSWPADGLALEGDVPATAYATTALVAMGADPAKDLKTSNDSTPLGYLTAHADKGLDGYADLDGMNKKSEPAAAAAVLMALAANEGYADAKGAFDVYDVQAVKRPETAKATAKASTTPVGTASSYRGASATKTIPQSGDETPWTVGFASAAALFGLAAALTARRRIRES